ncbi:MAG TPA: putative toxin-antitoxin system toxin component, PIN family [Gemmataceae bacterium]|nr:putative toxin-antitoxin system toxin component, PIN family [Gemmataceae bacterium]
MSPPAVVFDCVVYLQAAARAEGPARACLALAQGGHVRLCISPSARAEVEDVLNRPGLRRKFSALTDEAVARFLEDVGQIAQAVEEVPHVLALPRDPKDEPYLNLALAVGADYLVTWDKDLLALTGDDSAEGTDLRQRLPRLVVLTPPAFLQAMRQGPTREPGSAEETLPG